MLYKFHPEQFVRKIRGVRVVEYAKNVNSDDELNA